jgi:CRISPR-associated endonuclease Cas1
MLANVILDDFDNDMQAAGFKLIRFADDFVVLCKSLEQAQLARETAEASLLEHGLTLNKDKTRIASMDNGFHYLGYLFINDMALESPKRLRPAPADAAVSKHSWLSRVTVREPKAITPPQSQTPIPPPETAPTAPAHQYGERDERGLLLCVTGDSCLVRTQDERLYIERGEQTLYDVPWRQLHAVLLLGRHNVTTPALTAAMECNIALHFASMSGKYQGVVWNGQAGAKGSGLWLKQQQSFARPADALLVSREIVGARLSNIRETLRLRGKEQESLQIDGLSKKLAAAQTLTELNGLEGSATRIYFSALKTLVPAEFGFDGRNRQPPLDPFNALLSLGFSVLYSCLESLLRTDGLLPWQGVYHQPHGKHATLASDLMEPFRHIVERLALALIKRRELKPDDFYLAEGNACYLKKDRRNYYLSQLMAKFDSKITAKGEAEAKTLFEHIHQQNLSLIRFIEQGESFKAWRIR